MEMKNHKREDNLTEQVVYERILYAAGTFM